jgi:hypothetical protein
MANFGALGTLRNAYQTLIKPSTSALVRSASVSKRFSELRKSETRNCQKARHESSSIKTRWSRRN